MKLGGAAFGYLRERLYCEQRVIDLWLSRDMRRVNVGERRPHALVKSWQTLSFLISDGDGDVPFARRNLDAA